MRPWQRAIAADFLAWRRTTGRSTLEIQSMCAAVESMSRDYLDWQGISASDIVSHLPRALTSCDKLQFADPNEALAYLILHLVDRYGRVTDVLERLLEHGWLPIRRRRLTVLDIGAGPAPAIYAATDMYTDLADWVRETAREIEISRVTDAHVLDRGPVWDFILHQFSEQLMAARRSESKAMGVLPFRRTFNDLGGFTVHGAHHEARAAIQKRIVREYERDDEWINSEAAWVLAHQEEAAVPSAYDLIVLCNFLTNTVMTDQLRTELHGIIRSLTPGGVLLVLGGTGGDYPSIYAEVTAIAQTAHLAVIQGFAEPIIANPDPIRRGLIRDQIRGGVARLAGLAPDTWKGVHEFFWRRARDVVDDSIPFELPSFQVLAFRRQLTRISRLAEGYKPGSGS